MQTLDLPSGPLALHRVRLMGILSTTPDSFYDGERYSGPEQAVARAHELLEEGADIIDVGPEKARSGEDVPVSEELRQVVPLIEAIRRDLTIPLSVATLEPEVARAALLAGADIINSIDGFRDPQMRRVAAETGAALVVMHIHCQPRVANPNPQYDDLVADVRRSIAEQVQACLSDGISPKRIILDPRAGFGKTTEQDIAVLRGLDQLTSSPYPVLLAVSRTTFISGTLGTDPDNRLERALAVAAWGVMKGVKIIRVHDVRATRRVCSMVEAVLDPTLMEAAE